MKKEMNAWRNFLLTEHSSVKARAASRQLTRIYMLMIRTFLTGQLQRGLVYDKEGEWSEYRDKWNKRGKIYNMAAGKGGAIFPEGLDTVPTLLDQWLKDGLPQPILHNLRLRLTVTPEIHLAHNKIVAGDPVGVLGGGAKESGISIRIGYNKELLSQNPEQHFGNLLSQLDGVVYHEFVHYLQYHDLIKSSGRQKSVDEGDLPAIIKRFQKQLEAGLKQGSATFIEYMLQPAEIEAYARAYYVDSRNLGVPWEQLIDAFFEDVMESVEETREWMGVSVTPEQIKSMREEFKTRVKPELFKYAEKNLPCATLNNGKPVSSKCPRPTPTQKVARQALKKMKTMWGGAQGIMDLIKKKSPFSK